MMNNLEQEWANLFESNNCPQLAAGLRQSGGIGQQVESTGSLNGPDLDNPYSLAINSLSQEGLAGNSFESVSRTVETVFASEDLVVNQQERDVLTQFLIDGLIP